MGKSDRSRTDKNEIQVSGIDIVWHPKRGTCEFERLPVAMMWVDTTLAGVMAGVQAMVGTERFALTLQSEGRKSVEADWEVISKSPDFRDGFEAIANIAAVAGWGDWTLVSLDADRCECRFSVTDSWEGRYQKALGVSWGCAMLAGKMAGYCTKLFGVDCWADQTAFIARGDPHDEFVVAPSDRSIEREIENLLVSDKATRADMAVALRKLENEIAERTRIEESLRESEALFRSQFEYGNIGIAILSPDGAWLRANARLCEMLGYPESELRQKPWTEIAHPEELPIALAQFDRILKGDADAYEMETRLLRKDGIPIHAYLAVSCCRNADASVRFVIASLRDITERKWAEEQLCKESAFRRAIIERAAEGLCVCRNIPGFPYVEFTVWNPRMTEITGYAMAEINRLGWYQTMYPDPETQARARERMERMREGEDLVGEEWVITRKDGQERHVTFSTAVVETEDGTKHVLALMHDDTDRRRAEEAEQRARREWEGIFQAIGHPTLILSPDHKILMANRAMANASGKSAEELRGEFCYEICHGPGCVGPPKGCPLEKMLSSGQMETEEMEVEAFGGIFLVSCTPVRDEEGRLEKVIHIATDITARKRAEAQRLELERQLLDAQRLESLGVLAGGIAHDFNNLLMIVLGNLDVALGDVSAISPVRATIEQAMQATRRATDLTRQLLAYSGRGQFEIMRMDLNELVRENADLFRTAVSRTAIVDVRLAEEPCVIEADPGQVQQIIMNLITNASEAIGANPGVVTLTTGVAQFDEDCLRASRLDEKPAPGEFVLLEVSDTGCGMNDETIERIFDPFFTTKFAGRGLGMSAVMGIVRGHKGAVMVQSAVDRGSTIRVLLPACGEERIEAGKPARALPPSQRAAQRSGKFLVVDDEESILDLCAHFLTRLGFQVLTASDGERALEVFRKHGDEIVCVLLDLTMPRMDGLSVLREMRRIRSDVKVILCSGYAEQDATKHFKREGLSGFLQKPYLMWELRDLIDRVLA